MKITLLEIDLGKTLFSPVGLDREGRLCCVVGSVGHPLLHSSTSKRAESLARRRAAVLIIARQFAMGGHEVRLMPPGYVKPYMKSHKNDDR